MADAERLATARQQIAHEGTGYVPAWNELTDHEREMSVIEAGHWIKAAARAGYTVVPTAEYEDLLEIKASQDVCEMCGGRGWLPCGPEDVEDCPACYEPPADAGDGAEAPF